MELKSRKRRKIGDVRSRVEDEGNNKGKRKKEEGSSRLGCHGCEI